MKATDFDFSLPANLIAARPSSPRDSCRLLIVNRNGTIEHKHFFHLPGFLDPGDLLLLNNTRVFPARLLGKKKTGGKIEMLLVREISLFCWEVLCRERYSGPVSIANELSGELLEGRTLTFPMHDAPGFRDALWNAGLMPLPPYIRRKPDRSDTADYQTVFAARNGSIAAPTAGLHFSEELIRRLQDNGVIIRYITLHIGTGTFKPIRTVFLTDHTMDEEFFEIDQTLLGEIREARATGKRIISVGTTTTRALEGFASGKYKPDASASNGKIRGTTDIFIYPGYRFRSIDSLITNFHLPQSTPLMLTAAFCGRDRLIEAYQAAISIGYRFFTYGDAMLVL